MMQYSMMQYSMMQCSMMQYALQHMTHNSVETYFRTGTVLLGGPVWKLFNTVDGHTFP